MQSDKGLLRSLGSTDLEVFPLCLGGNVFGWTIDEERSFAVLDAYVQAGGNFIDTADTYGRRGPDGPGASERIIGRWIAARGNRDELVLATKVGMSPDLPGLSAATIREGIERSLARLGVERGDLYYAPQDDPATPIEATLGAFDEIAAAHQASVAAVALAWLMAQPTVAAPVASATSPGQLAEVLAASELELSPEQLERLSKASA